MIISGDWGVCPITYFTLSHRAITRGGYSRLDTSELRIYIICTPVKTDRRPPYGFTPEVSARPVGSRGRCRPSTPQRTPSATILVPYHLLSQQLAGARCARALYDVRRCRRPLNSHWCKVSACANFTSSGKTLGTRCSLSTSVRTKWTSCTMHCRVKTGPQSSPW